MDWLVRLKRLSKRTKILVAGAAIATISVVFIAAATSGGGASPGSTVRCQGGYVLSSYTKKCVRAGDPNFGETRSGEREHTPEEEAAHNKSLEIQRRNNEQEADAQQKVNEAENEGGEHSIRRTEEKVCYESGKSSAECEGPLKETPEEEAQTREHESQLAQEQSAGSNCQYDENAC